MAALSTGGGAESTGFLFHGGGGCNGCGGCSGCYGYTAGWGCNGGGCRGGGCHGGGLFGRHFGRGCNGGCYGGCAGAGYGAGCYGAATSYGCAGNGGCYGNGGVRAVTPYRVIDPGTAVPRAPEEIKIRPKPEPGASIAPNRARLVLDVPADAKVFIDDTATTGRSSLRSFTTPELQAGQEYYYEVRAELVRDGQTIAHKAERITFRAGEEKRLVLREVAFKPVDTKATAQR
jgi:uncharacterized protein (TIGR03000 family)